jgi:hypothetical protein
MKKNSSLNQYDANKALKIVIYRPYREIWFKNPTRRILSNTKWPNKYEGLFDYLVESDNEIYLSTGLLYGEGVKGIYQCALDAFRLIIWCLFNRINLKKVKLVFTKNQLTDKDVIFFMHYGVFTHEQQMLASKGGELASVFSVIPIFKVVHMTHYAYNIEIGSQNIKILKPNLCLAENNLLQNSTFFNKFYKSSINDFYQLPYTPSARFFRKKRFEERTNKLVVTGSIAYKMTDKDFIDFFQQDELQPMRRIIYQNANKFPSEIESLILDFNSIHELTMQGSHKDDPLVTRYYKRNIVDIYNDFTMFAVPEEICDLPAIGFVEGMACGAAFFGLDSPMYRDLGMIPGKHYVAYDGSLEDLVLKINYYQNHDDELLRIADYGHDFAHLNLSKEKVYESFVSKLTLMVRADNSEQ